MAGAGTAQVQVMLNLSVSGWTDVTSYVRVAEDGIMIRHGYEDEAMNAAPSQATFTLDNSDGRFSPTNPNGAYYGQIKRGVEIKILANYGSPTTPDRFHGYVYEWPVRWGDASAKERHVAVVASGLSRKLNQSASISPMRRDIVNGSGTVGLPVSYWPCEGGSLAEAGGSVMNQPFLQFGGTVSAGSLSLLGSGSLPTFKTNGQMFGQIPAYSIVANSHTFTCIANVTSAVTSGTPNILDIYCEGTIKKLTLTVSAGVATLTAYDQTSTSLGTCTEALSNGLYFISINATYSSPSVIMTLEIDAYPGSPNTGIGLQHYPESLSSATTNFTASTQSVIAFTGFCIGPAKGIDGCSFGHVAVWNKVYSNGMFTSSGYQYVYGAYNERADTRFKRILAAFGYSYVCPQVTNYLGSAADSGDYCASVPTGTLINALQDCVATDGGILVDSSKVLGMEFYTRAALYRAATTLTLDVSAGQVSGSLVPQPTFDDQHFVTETYVTSTGGGSQIRYAVTRPEGVYSQSVSYNFINDVPLNRAAEMLVAQGTVSDMRIPKIRIDLAANLSTLASQWLSTFMGSVCVIQKVPADLGAGSISYLVIGWEEFFDQTQWYATLNLSPLSRWTAGLLSGSNSLRLDTDASTVSTTVSSTATSIQVATTSASSPLWTTSIGGTGSFQILASTGEVMNVTAISGASSPQTFTVTRSINGIVASLPSGTSINLYQPFKVAR